jgi:lipopolysaccharide export LptBFGC system permease protein LptF
MNHFGEYKVIVDKMDRRKKKISGVSIYKMNPEGAPTRILAPEGEVSSSPEEGLTIKLANGAIHQPSRDKESQYTITKFNAFALRIPAKIESEPRVFSPREMTYGELESKIAESHRQNQNPAGLETEENLRVAIAFSPLVFVVLGTVLGIRLRKGSKSVSIGVSLVVILVYYGLFVLMVSLSSQGFLPSFLLTWFPNLLTLAAGGILWRRLAKQ